MDFIIHCFLFIENIFVFKLALTFGCESQAVNICFSLVNNNRWKCKTDQ